MTPGRQSFIAICFLLLAAVCQGRLAHAVAYRSAEPDFLLVVLACASMLVGGYWGVGLGFLTGYLTAALYADPFVPFGTILASRTIAGAFAAGLQRSVIRDSLLVPPLVVAVTTFVCDCVFAAMDPHAWLHHTKQWFRLQVGQLLFNTVLSYPVYLILRKCGLGFRKEDPFGIAS